MHFSAASWKLDCGDIMRYFVKVSLKIFHLETGEKSVSVVTSALAVTRQRGGGGSYIILNIFHHV